MKRDASGMIVTGLAGSYAVVAIWLVFPLYAERLFAVLLPMPSGCILGSIFLFLFSL
jgi:hypothetical protein